MKNTILSLMFIFVATLSTSVAFGLDLETARSSKAVTELPNGFLKANNESAKSLVEDINAKRKSFYEDIAKKNGLTVEQVGEQAAKKIAAEKPSN